MTNGSQLDKLLPDILSQLGLTAVGALEHPHDGRIARNIIVPTLERSAVLVRAYPDIEVSALAGLEYGAARARFEARALAYMSSRGCHVPKPIPSATTGEPYSVIGRNVIIAYPLLPGHPIDIDELGAELVYNVAAAQAELLATAATFPGRQSDPDGDEDYIHRILTAYAERAGTAGDADIRMLLTYIDDKGTSSANATSPRGLVHGDFFFENVLHQGQEVTGIIDFGDAYVGRQVMDAATGAMEFAFDKNELLRPGLLRSYLAGLREWLASHAISAASFNAALLANCVRFAAHTLTIGLDTGAPEEPAMNKYVRRFRRILQHDGKVIEHLFAAAMDGRPG